MVNYERRRAPIRWSSVSTRRDQARVGKSGARSTVWHRLTTAHVLRIRTHTSARDRRVKPPVLSTAFIRTWLHSLITGSPLPRHIELTIIGRSLSFATFIPSNSRKRAIPLYRYSLIHSVLATSERPYEYREFTHSSFFFFSLD